MQLNFHVSLFVCFKMHDYYTQLFGRSTVKIKRSSRYFTLEYDNSVGTHKILLVV